MAGSQTDVTEWRRVQDTLATAARHDHLTGLPNRRLFAELLQRSIAQNARATTPKYSVLFIDLDGFKLVNDSLGHLVGDQFLVAIASRLEANLRPGDALARLGGDEFAAADRRLRDPRRGLPGRRTPAAVDGRADLAQRPRAVRVRQHRRRARRTAVPHRR